MGDYTCTNPECPGGHPTKYDLCPFESFPEFPRRQELHNEQGKLIGYLLQDDKTFEVYTKHMRPSKRRWMNTRGRSIANKHHQRRMAAAVKLSSN